MPWLTSSIVTDCFLPTKEFFLDYDGSKFLIRPETNELHSTISIEFKTIRQKDYRKIAHEKLKKFLSLFCYLQDCAITELTCIVGPKPMEIEKSDTLLTNESFQLKKLHIVKDEKLLLALALFREAKALNNPFYKFFGFQKVININYNKSKDQIIWMDNNLRFLRKSVAKIRLCELNIYINDIKDIKTIGEYLYKQGRCAIAHAFHTPYVNPDLTDDILRIKMDIPLIEELARVMIEKELFLINK